MKDTGRGKGRVISLRNVLRKIGPQYDTDEYHEKLRFFWKKRNESGVGGGPIAPGEVFGKDYQHPSRLPNTDDTVNLVKNLLVLIAIVRKPADIRRLICDGGKSADTKFVDEMVELASWRSKIAQWVINNQESIRNFAINRPTLLEDQFPTLWGPGQESSAKTSAQADVSILDAAKLFHFALLEREQQSAPNEYWDTPPGLAHLALRLFELGQYSDSMRCAKAALEKDRNQSVAIYVEARLHLAESSMHALSANQNAFTAEVTSDDESGFVSDAHADESLQHAGAAVSHRAEALKHMIRALVHWPQAHGEFDHRDARLKALRDAVKLAVYFSRGRQQATGLGLGNADDFGSASKSRTEREGRLLDQQMLKLLQENEASRASLAPGSVWPADIHLEWLQLYFVLDDASYKRYAEEWLNTASRSSPLSVHPTCDVSAYLSHLLRHRPDLDSFCEAVSRLRESSLRSMSDWWATYEGQSLLDLMRPHYRSGDLEAALKIAERIRTLYADPKHAPHQKRSHYTCVRILYDLCQRAIQSADASAAVKWFDRIANETPTLIKTFDPDQPSDYLESMDEDDCEFSDELGNQQDIFGSQNYVPEEKNPSPLRVLLETILALDSVTEQDRLRLRGYVGLLPKRRMHA